MDKTYLARTMLEWQEAQAKADLLKMDIEAVVLELRATQTVGNVRASYSAGRKSYDYETAARESQFVSNVTISLYTTPSIDWRGICKHAGIDDIPFT
jgi:hypothetical protein